MHEASIIEYTLQAVERAAKSQRITKVTEITLVIGKIKVAVPNILRHSFNLLTGDTMFEGSKLMIEEREAVIHCEQCKKDIQISDLSIEGCPCCGSKKFQIVQGNELLISSFKGY